MHNRRLPLIALDGAGVPPKLRSLVNSCFEADPARRPAVADILKVTTRLAEVCLGCTAPVRTYSARAAVSMLPYPAHPPQVLLLVKSQLAQQERLSAAAATNTPGTE